MQLDPITRAVLDAMQEGVLIIDAQERIVYGNRAYVAFLEKEAARFFSPSPNPTLSSPKTFIKWGGHATGVRSGGRLWEQRAR